MVKILSNTTRTSPVVIQLENTFVVFASIKILVIYNSNFYNPLASNTINLCQMIWPLILNVFGLYLQGFEANKGQIKVPKSR